MRGHPRAVPGFVPDNSLVRLADKLAFHGVDDLAKTQVL